MNIKALVCILPFILSQPAFAWTYQDVRAIIERDPNVTRIEDVLERLDSELLSNYLLLHRSNSLQQASLASPRVILFSDDGRFLMGFNGDANFYGFNRLEMIQFNDSDKKFEFYSVRFPETSGEPVIFSEKNPEECQTCHRVDLRPNWDAYPFWKDAYGSISDSEHQRVDMFPETKLFRDFLAGADQNPRYKRLQGLQSQNLEKMSKRNLDFNRAVGLRNFEKIAKYLETTPEFSNYKYAFVGAFQKCEVQTFIPAEIQRTFTNNLEFYLRQAEATDRRIRQDRSAFVKRTETFYQPQIVGALRYLLEARGVPTGSWSMVLGEEDFHLSTGSSGVSDLGYIFLTRNPELKGLGCKELKQKSLRALGI